MAENDKAKKEELARKVKELDATERERKADQASLDDSRADRTVPSTLPGAEPVRQ